MDPLGPETPEHIVPERMLRGRYRLDEVIDGGATATVWRAHDTQLDRAVAIKILDRRRPGRPFGGDEDDQLRFRDEARALARLSHPHIVTVFDSGTEDGAGFLVMELVEGRSVSSRLEDGALPVLETAAIVAQVCDALAAAHAAGIVHRDIKPGNIVVTPSGTAKVCDFGIARLQGTPALTHPDVAVGTSSYMAPEQVSSQPVDGRADLYAVGCVLFEMLTGTPPFVGETALGIAYQHVHAEAPSLRSRRADAPRELDALVAGLLAKDPDRRPADAAQVRAELAAFVAARDTAAIPGRPGISGSPGRSGTPGILSIPGTGGGRLTSTRSRVVVAAAVIVAVPAIAFAAWPEPRPTPEPGSLQAGPSAAITSSDRSPSASPELPAVVPSSPWTGPGPAPGPQTEPVATAAPTTSSTAVASPSPSPSAPSPLQQVANLRTLVQRLVNMGQLAPEDAGYLNRMLQDLANTISEGNTAQAQVKIANIRQKNDELLRDNKISVSGHDRLDAGLVRLSTSL